MKPPYPRKLGDNEVLSSDIFDVPDNYHEPLELPPSPGTIKRDKRVAKRARKPPRSQRSKAQASRIAKFERRASDIRRARFFDVYISTSDNVFAFRMKVSDIRSLLYIRNLVEDIDFETLKGKRE